MTHSPIVRLQAIAVFVASSLVIIAATLAPFNFSFSDGVSWSFIAEKFRHKSYLGDLVFNILLYIPIGFGFGGLIQGLRISKVTQCICILWFGFILSGTVEVLQVFLPDRSPSSIDIYANTIGAFIGLQCFNRWQLTPVDYLLSTSQTVIRERIAPLPTLVVILGMVGYALLALFLSLVLQTSITLGNWSQAYPLRIGYDILTGTVWNGSVSSLAISERALPKQDIQTLLTRDRPSLPSNPTWLAAYELTGNRYSYADQIGRSPLLIHRDTLNRSGLASSPSAWLETEKAVSVMSQRIRTTSQFTLDLVLAPTSPTAQATLGEPAVILTLSGSETDHTNLTLLQQEDDLIVRLRTPITGERGTRPEIVVPNVFSDASTHHLVGTYRHRVLRFYVDDVRTQYTFKLSPGLVLFQRLLPLDKLRNTGLTACKIMYHGLIFIPLGLGIGVLWSVTPRHQTYRMRLLLGTGLLMPVFLEVLRAAKNFRELDVLTIGLGIGFVLGSVIFMAALSRDGKSRPLTYQSLRPENINL